MNGNVNEWNEKTAEITGYSAEEAMGKPLVKAFIVQKLKASVQQIMDLALQGNETSNYELEFTTKSKQIRYLLVNASTRRDPENNIVGVLGVAQDVTESSKNERRVAAIALELVSIFHVFSAISFAIQSINSQII